MIHQEPLKFLRRLDIPHFLRNDKTDHFQTVARDQLPASKKLLDMAEKIEFIVGVCFKYVYEL
jgi:hypothetical protein